MYSRQIARYLPHHRSENASKTHPKSSHDKFKTASYSSQKDSINFIVKLIYIKQYFIVIFSYKYHFLQGSF